VSAGVYYNPGPMFQPSNWYGVGAPWPAGYTPPNQPPKGSAYGSYFQQAGWMPNFFGGLDTVGQGALEADPMVGYGAAAGRVAPNTSSNLYRYIVSQAGRLHNDYALASLQDPSQTWPGYISQHVPDLERDFRYLSPEQRGESARFAQGGGRFLG
jgi:hypothetical protein